MDGFLGESVKELTRFDISVLRIMSGVLRTVKRSLVLLWCLALVTLDCDLDTLGDK